MYEPVITIQGWVGTDVELRQVGDSACATFRVGATPRFRQDGQWRSGPTSWFTVEAWRTLATNVAESIKSGDAVIVQGRVRVETWQPEGQAPRQGWKVEAFTVGHDLRRGTSQFVRPITTATPPEPDRSGGSSLQDLSQAGTRAEGPTQPAA